MATTFASPPQHILPSVDLPQRPVAARYTIDGSDELEAHLQSCCRMVRDALVTAVPQHAIDGLMLGGGYGRGQGGVLAEEGRDHPYNDLEFYLFVRGDRHVFEHRFGKVLRDLRHELSEKARLEIELKVLTFKALERAPISMFFYDLLAGHKWLIGSVELLRYCQHHHAGHLLPLSEATRLLMNRCSGLLFATMHLEAQPFTSENADFVRRNIRKAQLAMGDAVLTTFGRYHWSCLERHNRLQRFKAPLPWRASLAEHHRAGVEFKLHPFRSRESRAHLESELRSIIVFAGELWLWLESLRLRRSFISHRHYALTATPKWPGSNPVKNILLNAKLFRRPLIRGILRHPRERILESLALLLWEPCALTDSSLRNALESNLRAGIRSRAEGIERYRAVWSSVS